MLNGSIFSEKPGRHYSGAADLDVERPRDVAAATTPNGAQPVLDKGHGIRSMVCHVSPGCRPGEKVAEHFIGAPVRFHREVRRTNQGHRLFDGPIAVFDLPALRWRVGPHYVVEELVD